jgi:hypothetical protein
MPQNRSAYPRSLEGGEGGEAEGDGFMAKRVDSMIWSKIFLALPSSHAVK